MKVNEIRPEPSRAGVPPDVGGSAEQLDPERLAELRRWIHAGGMDDPTIAEEVAERLLASGHL